MKRLLTAALCCLLAGALSGQKKAVEGPEHFRWSEDKASELDRHHTIQSDPDLTPDQKKLLTVEVVARLMSYRGLDVVLRNMSATQLTQLAADTRVELIDLNGDGVPEVIAQANGMGPCGETGNCIIWIFQWTGNGVRVLLDSLENEAGFEVITVRPWSTNGFRDIVLGSHSTATLRNLVWYRYSVNAGYRSWKCYFLSRIGDKGKTLKNPAVSAESCSDTFRPKE
jgi:hypothetical protein